MVDLTPPLHEGYSIWFMAEKAEHNVLQAEIDRLAKEYGGNQFLAHGTVIGLLDKKNEELENLKQKTEELAQGVTLFGVEMIGFGARNMYFQSVFLVLAPPEPLVNMNKKARILFGHENDPPFMPHMSLMYGNFDWPTKQEAARTIDFAFPKMVTIASIALVDVYGNPEEWHVVEDYPFKK